MGISSSASGRAIDANVGIGTDDVKYISRDGCLNSQRDQVADSVNIDVGVLENYKGQQALNLRCLGSSKILTRSPPSELKSTTESVSCELPRSPPSGLKSTMESVPCGESIVCKRITLEDFTTRNP